jgi:hypothetical protein
MSDDRLLADGPAGYWSEDRLPTLAQYRAITAAACRVLNIPEPTSRLEATTILARLRIAEGEVECEMPDPW